MRFKRILPALLAIFLLLCCTGCGDRTSPSTETPQSTAAPSGSSTEVGQPMVVDAYNGSRQNSEGALFTCAIPRVTLSGAEIDALNDELYQTFYTDQLGADGAPTGATSYDWYVCGDVLTLRITEDTGLEFMTYHVYSVRVSTAHVMTSEEVLSEAGLTAAAFEEQASAALGNAYCVWLSGELAQQEEPDARYLEQFQKTVSAENAAEAVPFLDESGALWLCGKVYQPAGGDYHEVLLPLTGYETSEFYSALLEKLG